MAALECPVCDGELAPGKVRFEHLGHDLGRFEAHICQKCGKTFFTERSSKQIERKAMQLGIWGLRQRTKVSYSGNSLVLRIPSKLAKALGITKGTDLELRPAGKGRILVQVVEP